MALPLGLQGKGRKNDMNWDDLRIVQAVCKTGSFARAARSLHLNETTVSRRVLRLEDELGVALFDAVSGERQPTVACRAVLTQLDHMDGTATDIARRLRARGQAVRELRLTTIPAVAEHFLAPGLGDLFARLPDLALRVDSSDSNVDMSRWEADFAIRLGRPRQGAFLMRKIGRLDMVLVEPDRPRDQPPPLALYPESLMDTPEMQALAARYPDARTVLTTSSLDLLLGFLQRGHAVGVLPDFLARRIPDDAPVTRRPLEVSRDVWLLSQPHLRDDFHAKHLSDWCASLFVPRTG